MVKEILKQYSGFVKHSQEKNDFKCLSSMERFVDNFSTWLLKEDSGQLPAAFSPLFDKSTEIIKKLSLLSPSAILQFDLRDKEKVLDFEEEILLFSVGKAQNKQTQEIIKCAFEYINFSSIEILRQSYLLWSALVITLFNQICINNGFFKSGNKIILKKSTNNFDWPWPYFHKSNIGKNGYVLLKCGLLIPGSWYISVLMIYNFMASYGKGPFFKKEGYCYEGINVSKEFLNLLKNKSNRKEILFTNFSPYPLDVPIIIGGNNDFISIILRKKFFNFNDFIKICLPILGTCEYVIDFYLYKMEFAWNFIRNEINRDDYLPKDTVLLKALLEFISDDDMQKYARHDNRLRKEISSLDNVINIKKDDDELVSVFKKLKSKLHVFVRMDTGSDGPGRPQAAELTSEHLKYLEEQLPKVNELYDTFKTEEKLLKKSGIEVNNNKLISKVKDHYQNMHFPSSSIKEILKTATTAYLSDTTKRREDFRLVLLSSLLKDEFKINSDQNRLRAFLKSQG